MEIMDPILGKIFDIQSFSVHDGPGARTLIFMKGCSLHCFWCSNPEGIDIADLPMYYESKCILCGNCISSCKHNAIKLTDNKLIIDRSVCKQCISKSCIDTCYTDALKLSGRSVSVNELFKIIQRDRQYWGDNGGVTLTGGEPLLQSDFVRSFLRRCYKSYIHTAIETCANVPWTHFEQVLDYLDLIFFDLKHSDSNDHNKGTGAGNENIVDNLKKLNELYEGDLIFRLPLIPGYNINEKNLSGIANMILKTKWRVLNILPLHHYGREKYAYLNMKYLANSYQKPDQKDLQWAKSIFNKAGIKCYIGSELPV